MKDRDETYWARKYAKWREASGGKWWLYQYFKIADHENRKANTGKFRVENDDIYENKKEKE